MPRLGNPNVLAGKSEVFCKYYCNNYTILKMLVISENIDAIRIQANHSINITHITSILKRRSKIEVNVD